jgi:hypothetical protein
VCVSAGGRTEVSDEARRGRPLPLGGPLGVRACLATRQSRKRERICACYSCCPSNLHCSSWPDRGASRGTNGARELASASGDGVDRLYLATRRVADLKGAPGAVPLRGSCRLAAALLGLELDRGQGSQPGGLARARQVPAARDVPSTPDRRSPRRSSPTLCEELLLQQLVGDGAILPIERVAQVVERLEDRLARSPVGDVKLSHGGLPVE